MTNVIEFPSSNQRTELELDEMLRLIKVPNGVSPKDWEEIVIPEIKKFLRLPTVSKSFKMGSMTAKEASIFEKELYEFIKDYSFEVIRPAIIAIVKLYAQLLKNS